MVMGPAGGSCRAWDLVRFLARPKTMNFVIDTPLGGTTYEQAAARRDRLMEERKAAEPEQKPSSLYVPEVSFCEH